MKRKLLCLLLAIGMILSCILPAWATEQEETEETTPVILETVEINSVEDFLTFAQNCTLDSWSQDKIFILNTDVSLAGKDFLPIATFGGIFEGNGHTVSGFYITDSIVPSGLFRYLQPTALLKDLKVEGTVIPGGDAKFAGGIVGHNSGTLENCTFSGTVEGCENIGGIAGANAGILRKCHTEGSLLGEKSTGGIAGYNTGLIDSCSNDMEINTVSVDPTVNPMDIDLDFTTDLDAIANLNTSTAASDTGGIAGYSAGVVMGCRNTGTVGYPHIGYNLGGIIGRNCGYVTSCHNEGSIYGRKDVGGIVGQIEPDIATILSPDYLETLSDQFERLGNLVSSAGSGAASAGSEIQSYTETIGAYLNQAKAALNQIAADASGFSFDFETGQVTMPSSGGFSSLASAIQGMVNTSQAMANSIGDGVADMTGSVGAISGQINNIAKTFDMAAEDLQNEPVTDVSDSDIAEIRNGKVYGSVNSGCVQADLNVGGIVGVMALEAESDPEDDFSGGGSASQRRQYELKAIVQECINYGTIVAKQDYVGAVCGRMELGLITASEGYGRISSENGDYVGGIAGVAGGTIQGCFAKCTLSGKDYIGGIAGNGVTEDIMGSASLIDGCYSMVEIESGKQYLGAISGGESGTYTGNYFVSDTLGGVNRVSYFALAQPISYEELLKIEGLPQQLRRLNLTFVADGEILKALQFDFGDSFDDSVRPQIPEKDGYYARWNVTDLSDLHFDTVVEAEYIPHITAIHSTDVRANGNPLVFVQGHFQEGDHLMITPGTAVFECAENQNLLEHWSLSIPADGQENHTVRYLPTESATIYLLKNGTWVKTESEEMGSYLAFTVSGADVEFAAIRESFDWTLAIAAAGVILFLVIAAVVILRRKKKSGGKQIHTGDSPKQKKAMWIVIPIILLLIAGVAAVLLFLPQTKKAAQALGAYDVLKTYMEQDEQNMELQVSAKISDREIGATALAGRCVIGEKSVTALSENGRKLFFAEGIVLTEDGTAYKLNDQVPDYSLVLEQVLALYELVDVSSENGTYTIAAENDSATRILMLLMPAAQDLLSDANRLTIDLITENNVLKSIHFTGAGNLKDSVKTPFSVSATITDLPDTSGIQIPQTVADKIHSGKYQATEVYSDDLVQLMDAWKAYNARNPIGASITVTADCGPLVVSEDFNLYQWKIENKLIRGIEKDGLTIYLTQDGLLDGEGNSLPAGLPGEMDIQKLLSIVYQNFADVNFRSRQTEDGTSYVVVLNKRVMKDLTTALVPKAGELNIQFDEGTMELLIQNGEIHSVEVSFGGSAKVAIAEVGVQIQMRMEVMNGTITMDLPDAVKSTVVTVDEE